MATPGGGGVGQVDVLLQKLVGASTPPSIELQLEVGRHGGHHTKVLVVTNHKHTCRRIRDLLSVLDDMDDHTEDSNQPSLSSEDQEQQLTRKDHGNWDNSVLHAIADCARLKDMVVLTSLLTRSSQDEQKTIIQEAITHSLKTEAYDVLDTLITLQSGQVEADSFWKIDYRDVFRLCHEWGDVRTLVRHGLRHKGALLTQRDPCGRSVLQLALIHGDDDLCLDVITAEPQLVGMGNSCGQTPLRLAVTCSTSMECVGQMLEVGADPLQRSGDGHTPITEAAMCGNAAAIRLLAQHGANANITDRTGLTPLHHAVSRGHMACVQALLDVGANAKACSNAESNDEAENANDGLSAILERTPLIITAVQGGHVEIVRLLIEAGCDLSQRDFSPGWTALHYIVTEYPEPSCLELLLSSSTSNVDALTADGRTALMLAVTFGQCDMVTKLLKHAQCNVHLADTGSGMTALHRAADAGCHLCTSTLLSEGALPDVVDEDGATPLLLAVNSRHTHLMSELLTWGRGWWPWSPLTPNELEVVDIVTKRGYWDIGEHLVTTGWCLNDFTKCKSELRDRALDNMLQTPPGLKHLCRLRFKANLGMRAPPEINCLPFPSAIKSYLLFDDLSRAILHPIEQ